MNAEILDILGTITDEERAILDGEEHINRELYYRYEATCEVYSLSAPYAQLCGVYLYVQRGNGSYN